MNLTFFILFDFSSSSLLLFLPLNHSLSLSHPLSLWPSQNSNEIKRSLICMHLQNIACALFAVKAMERGWWWCWWASMCTDIDIKQSSDMVMGGQGKNGSSLRLCLDVGQGLSLHFSISPSISIPLFFSHLLHHLRPFLYFPKFFHCAPHLSSFLFSHSVSFVLSHIA